MERSVLILGETATGKSNYIGRCWIAVEEGASRLALTSSLPADIEAANNIANSLRGGRYCQHTPSASCASIDMDVSYVADGVPLPLGSIVLPDYSGEDCRKIYHRRRWSKTWERSVASSVGWLLFVRPDLIHRPIDWVEAQNLGGEFVRNSYKYDPEKPPSDVFLVELLQFLVESRQSRAEASRIPVGIVTSCWDSLPAEDLKGAPEQYIRTNLRLLYQFISSNEDLFDVKYFGLSSTAGDLNDDTYRRIYLNRKPAATGYVVRCDEAGATTLEEDVTIPIAWALGAGALPCGRA